MQQADHEYEYAEPVTVYGAAGQQVLRSPFGDGACEYAIALLACDGTSGTLIVSANGSITNVAATNEGGTNGYMCKFAAAGAMPVNPVFTPLRNGRLYISLNVIAGNISVVFVFRRARAVHIQEFTPMFHTADPANELTVNAARAQAIAAASESSTPRRR